MTIIKRLLQSVAAVAVVAVPLLAAGQTYPVPAGAAPTGPYTTGYPYVSTAYPIAYQNEAWRRVVGGTPLDPNATTVQVVPPQGGTVMLYRNGSMKGWWLQPSAVSVRPGQVYGVVATRGTSVLFNAAMVFRPGVTNLVWTGKRVPQIAYTPAWDYNPYGYGHGASYGSRYAAHPSQLGSHALPGASSAGTHPPTARSTASVRAASLPSAGVAVSPTDMRRRLGEAMVRKAISPAAARSLRPTRAPAAQAKVAPRDATRRAPTAKVVPAERRPSRAIRTRTAPSRSAAKRSTQARTNLLKALRASRRAPQG